MIDNKALEIATRRFVEVSEMTSPDPAVFEAMKIVMSEVIRAYEVGLWNTDPPSSPTSDCVVYARHDGTKCERAFYGCWWNPVAGWYSDEIQSCLETYRWKPLMWRRLHVSPPLPKEK